MSFQSKTVRKFSLSLFIAGILAIVLAFGSQAIAAAQAQNPDTSIKIEVSGYSATNKPLFFNFQDETDKINPQVKNSGKYDCDVEFTSVMPFAGIDDNEAFYQDNINTAWTKKSQTTDPDKRTITTTYKLNHKLSAGQTSEKLFNELFAFDGFTNDDIDSMPDELSINYSAKANFYIPDNPSDENGAGGIDGINGEGTDSKRILPNTGDSTNFTFLWIGVALILIAAGLYQSSKDTELVFADVQNKSAAPRRSHARGNHFTKKQKNKKPLFIIIALLIAATPVAVSTALAATQVNSDINIDIKLTVDKTRYMVDFDMNNATSAQVTSLEVPKNSKIEAPDDPERTGYTFASWQKDSNDFNFETDRITDNTTLSANYTINQYTLTFNKGEHETQDTPEARSIDYAAGLGEKPTITEEGWNLIAWCTDPDCTQQIDWDTYQMPAHDQTLYALWGEIWTVSFNTLNRSVAPSPYVHLADNSTLLDNQKPEPACAGFTFDGWYQDRECTTPFVFGASGTGTAITTNMELFAKWTPKTDTEYKVKHWFQNVDNNEYYVAVSQQDDLTGTSETSATVTAKSVPGFTNVPTKTKYQDSKITTAQKDEITITGDGSLVVNLYYDRDIKTVSFNANGHGVAPANQSVRFGGKVKYPTSPSAAGYDFDGWYTEDACTTPWSFADDALGTDDITLYAKWSPRGDTKYVVNYYRQNLDNDDYTPFEQIERQGTTDAAADFETKGYTGYTYNPYKLEYGDSETTATQGALPVAADGSLHINLYYDRVTVNVTFDINGHGIKPNAQNNIKYQGKVTQPADPSETGYTFGGFYKTKSCAEGYKWDFNNDTVGISDMTLYEKWTINTHTVTFNKNGHGEDADVPAAQSVDFNNSPKAISYLTEDGWEQIGWSTDEAGTNRVYPTTYKMPDADVTFYAVWVKLHYIDFNMNGKGTQIATIQGIQKGETVPADERPQDPTCAGYTFKGWYADPTFAEASKFDFATTTVNKNYVLYAKWEPATDTQYTVNHYEQNLNGNYDGVTPITETKTGTTEATVSIASLKKILTGFSINEYDTTYSDSVTTQASPQALPIAADGSLVVNLFYQRNFYNVTFNHQGKGGANTQLTNIKFGAKFTNPGTLTQTGYTHDGKWYKEAACTNEWNFDTDTMPGQNLSVYAKWTANTYKVKFNANGGSGSMSDETMTFDTAKALTSNAFTKTGYTFKGWSTSSTATSASYTNAQSVKNLVASPVSAGTSSVTLYAVWQANNYTVKFNGNGSTSGSMSNESFTYGASKALTNNAFSRTGYTFLGWSTSSSATSATYSNKQSVSNLTNTAGGTVNLYAVWKANSYTVKFNANGGSGSMSNESFTYGSSKALTSNAFTRTGYTFLGWSTSSSSTSASYSNGQSVSNLTSTSGGTVNLYAVWKIKTYTLTIKKFNGHDSTTDKTITANYNNAWSKPSDPTESGYTFKGYMTSDGGSTAFDWNTKATSDKTIYVKWEEAIYFILDYNSYYFTPEPAGPKIFVDKITGISTSVTFSYGSGEFTLYMQNQQTKNKITHTVNKGSKAVFTAAEINSIANKDANNNYAITRFDLWHE